MIFETQKTLHTFLVVCSNSDTILLCCKLKDLLSQIFSWAAQLFKISSCSTCCWAKRGIRGEVNRKKGDVVLGGRRIKSSKTHRDSGSHNNRYKFGSHMKLRAELWIHPCSAVILLVT